MFQIDVLSISVESSWHADASKRKKDITQQAAEARRTQTVPRAVAPGHTIDFPEGKQLRGGDEITQADLAICNEPAAAMHRLVARGVVLALDPEEVFAVKTGAGARYRVAPGKALMVRVPGAKESQAITEGAGVLPDYFADGELRVLQLVDLGYVVDEDPEPPLAA